MVAGVIAWAWRRAVVAGALALLLTIGLGWGLPRLQVDVSVQTLMRPDSPAYTAYEEVRTQFGSDRVVAIYVRDAALFQADRLARLRELNDALTDLPFVERVDSLYTLPDIRRNAQGFLATAPLLARVPEAAAELANRQQEALANPLLKGQVIAGDGAAMLLSAYLAPADETPPAGDLHAALKALVEPLEDEFAEVFMIGGVPLQVGMVDYIAADSRIIFPLTILVIGLALSLLLRSVLAGMLPLVNAAVATVWTLGTMAWLGIPINLLNYVLPALILVIGATEDVHVIHRFRRAWREHDGDGRAAMAAVDRKLRLTLTLTALTTTLGFAATGLNQLPVLQQFGQAAALAILWRFAATLLVLPVGLRLLSPWLTRKAPGSGTPRLLRRAGPWIVHLIEKHPRAIIGIALLLGLVSPFAASRIELNNDALGFLEADAPLVRQSEQVATDFGGNQVIYVVLRGQPGIFATPDGLAHLAATTARLRAHPDVARADSFADFMARIHTQMQRGDVAADALPASEALIAQYLLFVRPGQFDRYVSPDFSAANIVVRTPKRESSALNGLVTDLERIASTGEARYYEATVTGSAVLVATAVNAIAQGQVASLGVMTGLLFSIVLVLFLSVRVSLVTVLANLLATALVFAVMGVAGIPLNIGTCMVAAITIGLAVDDTLHLLVAYNRELKVHRNERKAVTAALRSEIAPILTTTTALVAGFTILGFSSFAPVAAFGLLSALVMVLALFADLMLSPLMLAHTRIVTIWDIIGTPLRRALLKDSLLFRQMSPWQARRVILACGITQFAQGTVVIREGDPANNMFVVLEGKIRVTKEIDGQTVVLRQELGPGEILGEVALVSEGKRSASVHALTEVRALVLDWKALERLRKLYPYASAKLFLNIAHILGRRLADREQVERSGS